MKKEQFKDLSEYERLILQAEVMEIKASKLMKYAKVARAQALNLTIKGEKNE